MDKTILIVDDEARMRHLISYYLKEEGFKVLEAENGMRAIEAFQQVKIDLVILDIMMPYVDGLDVCKVVRNSSNVPIIMLTAKSEEEDILLGYELGTDDYVAKPFSPKVLICKVKALLKRAEAHTVEKEGVINFNGIQINEYSREVKINGESINFSPKEFELLLFLFKNKGIVLSRDTILNHVWGYDYYGGLRAVDTHISKIREKLKDKAGCISTITGVGYKSEVNYEK